VICRRRLRTSNRALVAVAAVSFLQVPVHAPAVAHATADRDRAPATVVARARGANVEVHTEPNAASLSTAFPAVWSLTTVLPALGTSTARHVFPVQGRHGHWTRVRLPDRPNGSSGWIRTSDLTYTTVRYRIEVVLSERHMTARGPHGLVYEGSVAVGATDTPTPTGTFYLRARTVPPPDLPFYGPQVFVTSAHSTAFEILNGGDASILIQGNNDATVLGQAVTHGNLRVDNQAMKKLAGVLPLGTPVEIVA
jgi:lipoprotein-anchoring transpeptidase ErfK/SrfK